MKLLCGGLNRRRKWCRPYPIALAIGFAFLPFSGEAAGATAGAPQPHPLDRYNVVWTTPSKDSSGSMPIGNGDIGLNVWVEEDGDLFFYIGKTDAWSENVRLLKVGRVRIAFSPNPFRKGEPFRQALRLRDGEIEIRAGRDRSEIVLKIWVDANNPVVRVEADGKQPFYMSASLEIWRKRERELKGRELFSAYGMNEGPYRVIVYPDTVLTADKKRIVWFHRNRKSTWPITMRHQGLESLMDDFRDPLINRTFGGAIEADGFVRTSTTTLKSERPRRRHLVALYVLTRQTETLRDWLDALDRTIARIKAVDIEAARSAHRKWWHDFWNRSWIRVSGRSRAAAMTHNELPLRIGADSDGHNCFVGWIARARVFARALRPAEVALLARSVEAGLPTRDGLVGDWTFGKPREGLFVNAAGDFLDARIVGGVETGTFDGVEAARLTGRGWVEVAHDPRLDLSTSCTLDAWIAPEKLPPGGGRIIDKSKAGTSNGYMLDTYPGNSLRMIVSAGTLTHDARLARGKWVHVAATFDAASGEQVLYVNGKAVASQNLAPDTFKMTRGYVLQRFINACGGRGAFPIKFNGSIFTVDARERGERFDADYRRWGGPYWFQNTRLPYWSMLAAGDFDLMQPLFNMYREMLPFAKARTRLYFGHDGAFFPETLYFWGAYANNNYGWDRKGKHISHVDNTYIRYYWSSGLELTAMMLDYYDYTGDGKFLHDTLVPLADAVITFYDEHYERGDDGKIVFEPAQALETWQEAVNPLPVIAGLRFVLDRLVAVADPGITRQQRERWERLRSELPELPTARAGDQEFLLPAEKFDALRNMENPELYAVFPYRLFGIGKAGLETGRATFERRRFKGTGGWRQDAIQAACLGLTSLAAEYVMRNFTTYHRGSRFPAFWGPNFDWIPDQDHGSVAMIALQRMLIQADGKKILLFPAWPRNWDVEFKLRAPMNTVVECVYGDGEVKYIKVTPERRARDIVMFPTG